MNPSRSGCVRTFVGDRLWRLDRPDPEAAWKRLGEGGNGADGEGDERPPYWVELWPAAVLLARFIAARAEAVRGRFCVEAGCGLGLASLVAASLGARVLAFDYEPAALAYARRNAGLNGAPQPLLTVMDWRRPAFAPGRAELLFGADILYERRFFEPVAALFEYALAPGGRAWIADPERTVSADAWSRLRARGWRADTVCTDRVAQDGQDMTVHIREISRNA